MREASPNPRWPEPDAANDFLAEHAARLIASYRRFTGLDLVDAGLAPARALYDAPFVVASHGGGSDPVFNYGNRAALALFEMSWAAFTTMPSRLSAEPDERAARERLLARVAAHGFIEDYSGVRISATGRRFRIRNATVWSVLDAHGAACGQAVMFREWEYL